jgi:2-hydroxychromene-2-carboxylate isomerase
MNAFEKLRGASPLVVYIDLKSPYAFIAIEPTRAVARAAGVTVEWRPFTLDIPSYLGSARLDGAGRVVENRRSASQWSGVKYAYRDARRYARLGGKVLRGTEKIWDSSLAGIGLLWAQQQSAAIVDRYLDDSYRKFWQRALDIEDLQVVTAQLEAAGADVAGFAEFATGAGRALHDRLNAEAFAAGIFGVPSYLVADEFWFGREHLPRVAWLLQGRVGPAPLPAYPLAGRSPGGRCRHRPARARPGRTSGVAGGGRHPRPAGPARLGADRRAGPSPRDRRAVAAVRGAAACAAAHAARRREPRRRAPSVSRRTAGP